jgi:hypothetical protein
MKNKPRIYYVSSRMFGMYFQHWVCESKYWFGCGNSPQEAYEKWLADVPKTAIGRFFRRIGSAIHDWLF